MYSYMFPKNLLCKHNYYFGKYSFIIAKYFIKKVSNLRTANEKRLLILTCLFYTYADVSLKNDEC